MKKLLPVLALLLTSACSSGGTPLPPTATPTQAHTPTPTILAVTPPAPPSPTPKPVLPTNDIQALVVVPDQYGGSHYLNMDNFELYGWRVTLAGVENGVESCGYSYGFHRIPTMTVNVLVPDIADIGQYDALVISPAESQARSAYNDLLKSQAALELISSAAKQGLALYATCAGVRVLAAADVIGGKQVAGDEKFQSEYVAAGATYIEGKPPPIIDGNIVTARRGRYYNTQNCEAIALAIESKTPTGLEHPDHPSSSGSFEQAGTVWAKTFGGSSADGARSVYETSDGDLVIAGYTYSDGAGQADIYLLKTDSDGNEIWSKLLGGPGWEYSFSAAPTQEGGTILVGYTTSFGAGSRDIYLVKVDANGNKIWAKTFGGPGLDVGMAVIETSDEHYLVTGYTESFGAGESDLYLVKVNAAGEKVWDKTFGGTGPEMGLSLIEASDGNYVIAGATGSHSSNSDVYLVKTDTDGNELWTKAFNRYTYERGNAVIETSDGGYVIAGITDSSSLMNAYLIKTDADGKDVWVSTFVASRFYDYANAIRETNDGGYLIAGATKPRETSTNDVYLIKTDAQGKQVWAKTFGGTGADWGSAIYPTSDGGFVIAGHTDSFGAGSFDMWLMKIRGK